jgi:hypothetical protein
MTFEEESLRKLLGRGPADASQTRHANPPPRTRTQAERVLEDHFEIGKWHQYDNHICKVCGVGFIEQSDAVDHWLSEHSGWTPPRKTAIVDTGLVAPSGNPIFKEVPEDDDTAKEAEE